MKVLKDAASRISAAHDGALVEVNVEAIVSTVRDAAADIPATRHPLGFVHFELTDLVSLAERRVRLHVWTPETSRFKDELGSHHAHTWTLASCVLRGGVRDTQYRPILDSLGEFFVSEIDYISEEARPLSDRVRLEVVRAIDVAPGRVYYVPDGVPHQTEITSLPTATLLVAREMGRTATPVYSRTELTQPRPAGRIDLPTPEAIAVLDELLDG